MTAIALQQVPLLAPLNPEELAHLAESLTRKAVPAQTVIFREGDHGDRFSIIVDGQVAIYKSLGEPDERLIRTLGAGEFVGEMSLFDRQGRRTASVQAMTEVELYEMTHRDFEALLQRRPQLAYEVVRVLSLRLDGAHNATIRDLRRTNQELERAYHELKAAQAQIIEKEKLEHELEMARRIQRSILPSALPSVPGYQLGALMEPARAVGGDFFDLFPLQDGRLGIVIADVSDKGMPSAIFMALTRSLTRAEASRGGSPQKVLEAVNRHLLDMNEAGMFVTLLYGILDPLSRELHYARAGHELPLLLAANGQLLPVPYDTGQVLGLFDQTILDVQRITVPVGGEVVLLTDGVTDAVNANDAAFGLERLQAAVFAHHGEPAQTFCDRLRQDIVAYQGLAPQFDDFTLVIVSAQPTDNHH
jgi:serine phosphatase RsbU (regulator of sigma subunit)